MIDLKSIKAIRVQIKLGIIPLNVYQLPDGRYCLAGRNVTDAVKENNATLPRYFGVKSLKNLPSAKNGTLTLNHSGVYSEGKSPQDKGLSLKQIKADTGETFIPVAIEDAAQYWGAMSQKGNALANAILVACTIESIERRADHALGIKVEEDERNALMELRIKRLLARRQWTDVMRDRHTKLFGTKPTQKQFRDWTVKANLSLFQKPHFQCNRDTMSIDEQMQIENFEFLCCRWSKKYPSDTPDQILDRVLSTF